MLLSLNVIILLFLLSLYIIQSNQEAFVEHMLCARHFFRLWCTVVNETDKISPPVELNKTHK